MLSLRHILIVTHLVNFINAGKVILVVTEGLTEDLLSHVATPALDALAAKVEMNVLFFQVCDLLFVNLG